MTRRKRKEYERQKQMAIHTRVNFRKKMCDNKQRYYNEDHAMSWAMQYNDRLHRNNPLPYRAYKCPHCRAWHLTTAPKIETTKVADEV